MKRLFIAFSLIFLSIILGCGMGKIYYGYSVHVKNIGGHDFNDVEIESQRGFWFRTGYLVEDSVAGIGSPQSVPPNDLFLFILKQDDGTKITRTVDLRDKVKKGFKGKLLFTINDDNELKYELQER